MFALWVGLNYSGLTPPVVYGFHCVFAVLQKLTMEEYAIIAVRRCPAVLQTWETRCPKTTTTPLIDSPFVKLFAVNASPVNRVRPTNAKAVGCALEPTTAKFAISGCQTKNHPTTAPTVAFVASVVRIISNTAISVACALTGVCTNRTIARPASTGAIVQCVKSICSVRVGPRTKCPADTPFTGTVSVNWRRTIPAVPFVKRRPKLANA